MKRFVSLLIVGIAAVLLVAGCGSKINSEKWTLDKNHTPLPDYVLNSSSMVKDTYIMASKYPDVLASVPCFCGCAADGHKSNMNCFIQKMGPGNTVEAWDNHGIT